MLVSPTTAGSRRRSLMPSWPRRSAQTPCSRPTPTIRSSATGSWSTKQPKPVSPWPSGPRGASARTWVSGARSASPSGAGPEARPACREDCGRDARGWVWTPGEGRCRSWAERGGWLPPMGRPPSIPAEKKTRIVLSVLAGEITVAEAAQPERTWRRWQAKTRAGGSRVRGLGRLVMP